MPYRATELPTAAKPSAATFRQLHPAVEVVQAPVKDDFDIQGGRAASNLLREVRFARCARYSSVISAASPLARISSRARRAAVTGSHWFGRKDDLFVMLWDKVAALESQLNEPNGRPPT
jgi:hypothetical protein